MLGRNELRHCRAPPKPTSSSNSTVTFTKRIMFPRTGWIICSRPGWLQGCGQLVPLYRTSSPQNPRPAVPGSLSHHSDHQVAGQVQRGTLHPPNSQGNGTPTTPQGLRPSCKWRLAFWIAWQGSHIHATQQFVGTSEICREDKQGPHLEYSSRLGRKDAKGTGHLSPPAAPRACSVVLLVRKTAAPSHARGSCLSRACLGSQAPSSSDSPTWGGGDDLSCRGS